MCGILITNDDRKSFMIKHRGIEQHKIYRESIERHFIHSRLPIQTRLKDDYAQPIVYDNGNILLFNGEIFNYDQRSYECDTSYLKDFFSDINSWEEFYSKQPEYEKWDGFWSIVFYLKDKNRYICFTDPLGKKQLYINNLNEICSEINPLINGSFDHTYFGSIYKWGYNIDDRTPFEGIKKLDPKYIYNLPIYGSEKITIPNFQIKKEEHSLEEALRISTARRLIAKKDYPIGVLLSGGLDSTIIVSILKELNAYVNYYTIENGESKYVKICEKYFNIKVKKINSKPSRDIDEIICKWNQSPVDMGSVFPQFNLFEAVKLDGVKIVLTGDGADELFGGYNRRNYFDTQHSDIFHELTNYHFPRLDRLSMAHTIELRNPFLGHDVISAGLYYNSINKEILKDIYSNKIPKQIINRKKLPLKSESLKKDPIKHRLDLIKIYKDNIKKYAII